jgi:hypothetical protein
LLLASFLAAGGKAGSVLVPPVVDHPASAVAWFLRATRDDCVRVTPLPHTKDIHTHFSHTHSLLPPQWFLAASENNCGSIEKLGKKIDVQAIDEYKRNALFSSVGLALPPGCQIT